MNSRVTPLAYMNLSQRPRILWGGSDTFEHTAKEPFTLGHFWCFHYYEYRAKVRYNDADLQISPCHIGICEPYARINYHDLVSDENRHFCFNFQLPNVTPENSWSIPLMTPKSSRSLVGFGARLRRATEVYATSPMDAEVELWAMLLTLAGREDSLGLEEVDTVDQRRIRRACSMVEVNLRGSIYAEQIAENLGISVSHLGRLFRKHLKCPVATYIRRRRVMEAHELLCFSVLPIQEVAARVGVADLANFNRMMKREFNLSPREIRERKNGLRVKVTDS